MKNIFTVFLLLISIVSYSQGIKLSGVVYTDGATHYHIDSLFSYPNYCYRSNDSSIVITFPLCISQADAKAVNPIMNLGVYQIPIISFQGKSAIGYPTSSSLYNMVKPWLQTTYGFTVTTFP